MILTCTPLLGSLSMGNQIFSTSSTPLLGKANPSRGLFDLLLPVCFADPNMLHLHLLTLSFSSNDCWYRLRNNWDCHR